MSSPASPGHTLDAPIWNALTARHRALAEGGALARRYPPAIAPFAALADRAPDNYVALRKLSAAGDRVVLFTPEPVPPTDGFDLVFARTLEQMVGAVDETAADRTDIVTLGPEDMPAMLALAELTQPGPFGPRSPELGTFLGIRSGGQLVAMAGERMKPAGYTEITAVCTHPEHRGRGHAQALLGALSRAMLASSETPFLHVFSENKPAIALYERMGMSIRRRLHVALLTRRA